MTQYTVHIAGSSTNHRRANHAYNKYCHASRQGIVCSLYADGDCVASANGASDRIDASARETFLKTLMDEDNE
jgi:hypothetical protein